MTQIEVAGTVAEIPPYAKACGILSLILAIVGFVVPVVGVLFITPVAILLGMASLYGGYKGMGIATLVIVVINLMVSPTFWLNVGAGATFAGASSNRFLTYFDAIGVIVMLYLAATRRRRS